MSGWGQQNTGYSQQQGYAQQAGGQQQQQQYGAAHQVRYTSNLYATGTDLFGPSSFEGSFMTVFVLVAEVVCGSWQYVYGGQANQQQSQQLPQQVWTATIELNLLVSSNALKLATVWGLLLCRSKGSQDSLATAIRQDKARHSKAPSKIRSASRLRY